MEIMINAGGSRKYHDSDTYLALGEDIKVKLVLDETIPTKLRQETHVYKNGCVWLSRYMLLHSVDKKYI